jgi:long-subunit acyl-CoA synthetase (AMP-forming)
VAAGAISVSLYSRLSVRELAAVLEDCQPKCVIVEDSTYIEKFQGAWKAQDRIIMSLPVTGDDRRPPPKSCTMVGCIPEISPMSMPRGDWRIHGRLKHTLVPLSGHNIQPEPLEQQLIEFCNGIEQTMVVGHGRPFLGAIFTVTADEEAIAKGLQRLNPSLPHYQRIRRFHKAREPFNLENSLLTVSGKLRRAAIATRYREIILGSTNKSVFTISSRCISRRSIGEHLGNVSGPLRQDSYRAAASDPVHLMRTTRARRSGSTDQYAPGTGGRRYEAHIFGNEPPSEFIVCAR